MGAAGICLGLIWELEKQTHLRASHLSALERVRPTTYDVGQIEIGDKVVE